MIKSIDQLQEPYKEAQIVLMRQQELNSLTSAKNSLLQTVSNLNDKLHDLQNPTFTQEQFIVLLYQSLENINVNQILTHGTFPTRTTPNPIQRYEPSLEEISEFLNFPLDLLEEHESAFSFLVWNYGHTGLFSEVDAHRVTPNLFTHLEILTHQNKSTDTGPRRRESGPFENRVLDIEGIGNQGRTLHVNVRQHFNVTPLPRNTRLPDRDPWIYYYDWFREYFYDEFLN